MTSLKSAIDHYKQIAKNESIGKRHYALGALEVLEKLKKLRDDIRDEMKGQYVSRGGAGGGAYWYNRDFVRSLDSLME